MAKHPHHDDDQSKKTPGSGVTPKKPIPNMSLDDDEPFMVEEVVEAEVIPLSEGEPEDALPIVEAAPESEIVAAEPFEDEAAAVLAEDDVVEEIAEAVPASDVLLSEASMPAAQAETPEPRTHATHPASDVKPASDAPASEVNLAELFGQAYAPPAQPATQPADIAAASAPTAELPVQLPHVESAVVQGTGIGSLESNTAEPVAEAAAETPWWDAQAGEEIAEVAEAETASAVVQAETAEEVVEEFAEIAEVEAASAVAEAEDVIEDTAQYVEEKAASAVVAAEEVEEAAEAEDTIEEVAEFIEEKAASAIVAAEEVEEIAEAEAASEIVAAEEVIEEAEAEVASAIVAEEAEPISAVVEAEVAEPISAVVEAEEFEEVTEASDVFAAEEVAETAQPSEMKSGEIAEILAEEIDEAEPASAVDVVEDDALSVTEIADDITPMKASDSAVLAEEPVHAGSSAVLFDDIEDDEPKKKTAATADFDKTVAFGGPASSAIEVAESDSLVTEEEVISDAEPASAVDLAEISDRKSSATGIDKVAEALESGVGLDSNELANTSLPEPSVEFDEILDEEDAPKSNRKAKAKADEAEVAEAIDDDAAEIFDMDDEPATTSKNGKAAAKAKATGDDIDIDDIFSAAEAAEATDADDAVEAEADEAFAEAAEAVEDEAPKKKKGKKDKARMDDDEEAAAAVADDEDEEDTSAKKKKGNKDKATVAPQAEGPGFVMRWAGRFFLMFLGMIVVVGALGAGLMFAAGDVTPLLFVLADDSAKKEAAQSIHKVPVQPKVDGRTQLDKLRESLAKGEYDQVSKDLATATDEAEFDLRGQAKWFAFMKQQAGKPLNKSAPQIKDARDDFAKAKNVAMIAQIDALLSGESAAELAKLKMLESMLRAEKEKTDKVLDNVADVLVKGEHIADKKMFSPATLEKVLDSLNGDRAALASVNKILTDAKYKDGEEGLKSVLKEKKAAEDSIVAVNKVLDNEKTKDKGDKGILEIIDARNKAASDLTNITKDRDDVLATVKQAYNELLLGKIVTDDKADPRKELVKGVQQARVKAESPLATPLAQMGLSLGNIATGTTKTIEQTFAMTKVFAELGFFRTRETFIQTPQQKLDTYIALLQDRKENNAKMLSSIVTETNWVLAPESKSTGEEQAKARYVQGLALRNQEKYAEARAAFAETLKSMPPVAKEGWVAHAVRSHKELTDPSAYYSPRADRLQAEGNIKGAIDEVNAGLKAMPTEARLFAQRGLLRLELARGQGTKVPEVLQKGIREDAEIAGKSDAFAAESMYIVGLLEEELGNVSEAEKLYRGAIKMKAERKNAIDDGGKYRVALGRLLLRDRSPVIAVPPAPPVEDKKAEEKVGAVNGPDRVLVLHPWTPMIVSAVIAQPGFEDVEDKEAAARLNETIKLANELIASANPKIKGQGHLLLGSAYSKLGRRTDGLKEYSKGMQLLYPGMQSGEMTKLIEEHPAFQQPDASGTPNPVMAERHFGEGMHFYWAKQYPEAETQFRQAIKYYDKDARYQYYFGLAQLGQKSKAKRDSAIFAFEQGARLEARTVSTNPLAVRDINASLERIQGELRALLNSYRYKTTAEPEEVKKGS